MTLYRTRLDAALAGVRRAPFLLDAVAAAGELAAAAAADSRPRAVALLAAAALDAEDTVTAIAAVHAAAAVTDDDADALLSDLLSHERTFLREHAAQALASRLPHLHAIGRLVAAVAAGEFSGMLAQRTLGLWAPSAPEHVALALEGGLASSSDRQQRARLVETLGLVPGDIAARALLRIATDVGEQFGARATAVAALGDRAWLSGSGPGGPGASRTSRAISSVLADLSTGDLAPTARLAALDVELAEGRGAARRAPSEGLRVAQLFLHADFDRGLTRAGAGDTGGVATLLVRLGDALASSPGIAEVLTLSRGSQEDALAALADGARARHRLVPVPLGVSADAPAPAMATAWPTRVAALRGIRRVLRALGPVDVLHLRMADVGSMVAAGVAADLGVATVFTLAPDPHAVIAALEATGALSRASFGEADSREHFWFRLRLVGRLADGAAHRVLFPRPRLEQELRALLGTDVDLTLSRPAPGGRGGRGGASVVPEGIDLSVTEHAALRHAQASAAHAPSSAARALDPDSLESLVAALPQSRHGLPVLLSVGRLHRVKGMATVVEAWAADPGLRARANLVIAGGDLDAPSPDEHEQLAHIAAVMAAEGLAPGDGLVMAGHRPHHVVADWMATTASGDAATGGGLVAAGGAYVCGSLKEEFGLALLEALAAGLVVVAPAGGGPATYVEDGVSGLLVDTRDPADVRRGARCALDLAAAAERPVIRARAQAMVAERFTVGAMAAALADVYSRLAQPARARA